MSTPKPILALNKYVPHEYSCIPILALVNILAAVSTCHCECLFLGILAVRFGSDSDAIRPIADWSAGTCRGVWLVSYYYIWHISYDIYSKYIIFNVGVGVGHVPDDA